MLRTLASTVALLLCAAAPAGAAPISSAVQLYTCCTPEPVKERYFAEVAASGARFARIDVELHGIFGGMGSRERPYWAELDRTLELARRHRVELLGIIRGSPGWLSSCPEQGFEGHLCTPRDPAAFGRLAGEVAAHARSVEHWEILNEPDARWAFKGSAEDYARMLSAARDAIRARAPRAKVVLGGLERPWEERWLRRVFAALGPGATREFDIAAAHLRLHLREELPVMAARLRRWRELLAEHGFHGPVWVTEHGYPADPAFQWDPAYRGGDAAQASFLRESIPQLAEAGADQVFVTLRDNLYGEFLSEGIVHIDEAQPDYPATRRLAFAVVRGLADSWDELIDARARRRSHDALEAALAQAARRSAAEGRALAAAIQQGAAAGHAIVARRLGERLAVWP